MFDVNALIDAAKAGAGIQSDYRLIRVVGMSDSSMYNYRRGITFPDDEKICKFCEMAGFNPAEYLIQANIERSKNVDVKMAWLYIKDLLKQSTTIPA